MTPASRAPRRSTSTAPEERDDAAERVKWLLEGCFVAYQVERRYVRKDGLHIWVNLNVWLECSHRPSQVGHVFVERHVADIVAF